MSKRFPGAFVHRKAHVQDSVLGEGTRVWQGASITRGAVLGRNCNVAPGAMLDGCHFGDGCRIGPSVSMGPGFKVGQGVFIGPSVTFANDAWPSADRDGWDDQPFRDGQWAVIVGDRASIGANAVILPGVVIGEDAVVAALAVVDRDVPAGMLWTRDGSIRKPPPKERRRRMRFAALSMAE